MESLLTKPQAEATTKWAHMACVQAVRPPSGGGPGSCWCIDLEEWEREIRLDIRLSVAIPVVGGLKEGPVVLSGAIVTGLDFGSMKKSEVVLWVDAVSLA